MSNIHEEIKINFKGCRATELSFRTTLMMKSLEWALGHRLVNTYAAIGIRFFYQKTWANSLLQSKY